MGVRWTVVGLFEKSSVPAVFYKGFCLSLEIVSGQRSSTHCDKKLFKNQFDVHFILTFLYFYVFGFGANSTSSRDDRLVDADLDQYRFN